MARKKTTPAPAEPTNAPEVAAEPKTQGQTAVTATEADSHKHTSEGVQPESLVTGNNSLSATASIATEPGDENSAGDAGLLDAQPGTGSVVADMQPSVSPNSLEVQIYPVRSYMDEGELRRRGGTPYMAPRLHAEDLVRRKLASLEPLKE
ncbi:hypothetical protein [Pseudomonas sp. AE27]|jgi:hypothetical protein|uniref:hypothetical protein n=1 Tax=Pseudomonas sp. AE27 TaxID=3127460 RepID=UPI0030D08BD4